MLQQLTDDGHMHWTCPKCQTPQTAHVSHEEVQYPPGSDMVALPTCACGTSVFLKTHYTEEELLPPKIYRDSQNKIVKVEFDGPTAYQTIEHLERDHAGKLFSVCDDVVLNPAITRHQELHRQLQAIGKKPVHKKEQP